MIWNNFTCNNNFSLTNAIFKHVCLKRMREPYNLTLNYMVLLLKMNINVFLCFIFSPYSNTYDFKWFLHVLLLKEHILCSILTTSFYKNLYHICRRLVLCTYTLWTVKCVWNKAMYWIINSIKSLTFVNRVYL